MHTRGVNPYMPSWEYVPDAEPHVFGDRVYAYGSHDLFRGHAYCLGDYVCYSAPVDDLTDWRYEGVIFGRTDDPDNPDGAACLYAPDVTQGPDGRYYLYYVLNEADYVSVAVCDEPAGRYTYLGNVRHADGTLLGRREGDMPQFDPAVLTEGETTYLYTGFSWPTDPSRLGATGVALGPDMLTITDGPHAVVPSGAHAAGTGFEGHAFFEAPSIRKVGDLYYLVYSTEHMNELAYATSTDPLHGFTYRGVIVSNADVGIDGYKPAGVKTGPGGNNHGGIENVGGQWCVFYHRHTAGHQSSRQGVLEPIEIRADGTIPQVEMTSCGPLGAGGALPGTGRFPAYIACNLFIDDPDFVPEDRTHLFDHRLPNITQDGRDGDELRGYVERVFDGGGVGFKYFDLVGGPTAVTVTTRGYPSGHVEVRTEPFGPALGQIPVGHSNEWKQWSAVIDLPAGRHALYLVYRGTAMLSLHSITLGA